MATLEARIRAAAANYAPLAALIGSGSPVVLRWYDTQLLQGSAYPAIVALTVSNPPTYVYAGRTPTSSALMQYTVWGGPSSGGVNSSDAVADALIAFFDQLDLVGCGRTIQQNQVVIANRRGVFKEANSMIFQRVLEVRVFSDDTK